jgi:hypothetical protein
MRTLGTAFTAAAALGLGLASDATAQSLPDDGPTGVLELASGAVLEGALVAVYHAKGAPVGAAYIGLVLERADGMKLYVPEHYLSDAQRYWVLRRWYYPPAGHVVFDAPGREPLLVTAEGLFELARAGLRAGPAIWEQSRAHFEAAIALAARDADGASDPAVLRQRYLAELRALGLFVADADGRWRTERDHYLALGWKQWRGRWVEPAEYARLEATEAADAKRTLAGLVDAPETYRRVHLAMVRAFPGAWGPDRRGNWPLVRFYGTVVRPPESKFPPVATLQAPEYLRLRVTHEDCAHVYFRASNAVLGARVADLRVGDRIEIFGRMWLDRGLILIECHGVALR